MMLGPRLGRYANGIKPLPLGTPVNCAMGLFVLWWGWLAFNSGSTFGVSGQKWEYAAKAAVMTLLSSFGGGSVGLFYTMYVNNGLVVVMDVINGVLGSLVSVTAGCFLYTAWDSIIIGCVGGILSCVTMPWFDMIGVDDPVGASSVHGICGIWGVLAVGLFAQDPKPLTTTSGREGLFKGGGWHLLGVQTLTCICLGVWSFTLTTSILWMVNKLIPIRMAPHHELLGADLAEHLIRHKNVGVSRALSQLLPLHPDSGDIQIIENIGSNPGHEAYLSEYVQQQMKLQTISGRTRFNNKLYQREDKESYIPHYAWIE